jgi:hypothetical protein
MNNTLFKNIMASIIVISTLMSCDIIFEDESDAEYKRFVPRISGYVYGEVLGLYVMNEENVVVDANVIVTTDSGKIQTEKELYYKNSYSFFLYSPYIPDPEYMPVIGDTIDTIDPFVFFDSLKTIIDQHRGIIRVSKGKTISCYPKDIFFEMENYPNNYQEEE